MQLDNKNVDRQISINVIKDVFFSDFTLVQISLWYNVTDVQ